MSDIIFFTQPESEIADVRCYEKKMFNVHELPQQKTIVIIIMPEICTDQLQGNNAVDLRLFFFRSVHNITKYT